MSYSSWVRLGNSSTASGSSYTPEAGIPELELGYLNFFASFQLYFFSISLCYAYLLPMFIVFLSCGEIYLLV